MSLLLTDPSKTNNREQGIRASSPLFCSRLRQGLAAMVSSEFTRAGKPLPFLCLREQWQIDKSVEPELKKKKKKEGRRCRMPMSGDRRSLMLLSAAVGLRRPPPGRRAAATVEKQEHRRCRRGSSQYQEVEDDQPGPRPGVVGFRSGFDSGFRGFGPGWIWC